MQTDAILLFEYYFGLLFKDDIHLNQNTMPGSEIIKD
jgi:hypothetical protein